MAKLMDVLSTPFDSLSDEELAVICARRPVNEEAWKAFHARFYDSIYWGIRHGTNGPPQEIDDLVQEAFLKIFRVLPRFNPARSKVKTFISRVVGNLVIDCWRRGSKLASRTISLEDDLQIMQLQAKQDPAILHRAAIRILDKLQDRSKLPLILNLIEGKDVKTICRELGLSQSVVYTARNWVHEQLHEVVDDLPSY